jgi:hypothetical protein
VAKLIQLFGSLEAKALLDVGKGAVFARERDRVTRHETA